MSNFIAIQLANGQFLDLFEDTKLNIELINDLLSDELLSMTFTYQFRIPATPENTRKLNFPGLVQVTNNLPQKVPATLYLGHIPRFVGNLINVNNVFDTDDDYYEYGFVGDKANIDLTKNIRNVFDGMDQTIDHYNRNVLVIRMDKPWYTLSQVDKIGEAMAGVTPHSASFTGIAIKINSSDGGSWTVVMNTLLNYSWTLNEIAAELLSMVNAGGLRIKMTCLNKNAEPPYNPKLLGPEYIATRWGTIMIEPAVLNDVTYTCEFARRYFTFFYSGHGPEDTFQECPSYSFPYRTPKNNWQNSVLIDQDNLVVFPILKACVIEDDPGTKDDESYDVYGGQNDLFPIRGDKFDASKSYPLSTERNPIIVKYGDPARYYVCNEATTAGQSPDSNPEKWSMIPDQDYFINHWSNSGATFQIDNNIYLKPHFRKTVIPCIYLHKLVKQIFINDGIELVGDLLSDAAFEKIIIVYNKTLDDSVKTEYPIATPEDRAMPEPQQVWYWNNYKTVIHIGDYLPDMSIGDFINALRNYLGIGFIFTNKKCEMVWMDTILKNTGYVDLTAKTRRGIQIYKDEYKGVLFESEKDGGDKNFEGTYPTNFLRIGLDIVDESKAKKISTPISSLIMGRTLDKYLGSVSSISPVPYHIPVFGNQLSSDSYGTSNSCNLRLLWYNGVQADGVPFATSEQPNPTGTSNINPFKLSWDNLLTHKFYTWYDFYKRQKSVKHRFNLTLPDLMTFDFKNKIRVNEQNYMVKKLNISVTMDGIEECQKEIYSVK